MTHLRHLAVALPLALAATAASALPLAEVVRNASPSVSHLSIRDAHGEEVASGSGFVITEDGWIATNFHVADEAEHMTAVFPDGKEVEIVGSRLFDPEADLAVLQLKPGKYAWLHLATTPARQGDDIVVIGSPRGLGAAVSTGIVAAVREKGTVTRRDKEGEKNWGLQITAGIAHGSSGSPILNSNAEVVGVAVGAAWGEPLYFGVPVERLQSLLKRGGGDLKPLATVRKEESILRNLLISAGLFGIIGLVWWWMTIRSAAPPRTASRGWRSAPPR